MKEVTHAPVRSVLAFYIGGGWGKEQPEKGYDCPAWVIRGTDFGAVSVGDLSTCPYRFHKASNVASRRLQAGDIAFEVSGGSRDQPVGRSVMITNEVISRLGGDVIPASFCKLVRPNPEVIDPEFLFWFFQAIYSDRRIMQFQVQSTGISNFQFEMFLDGQDVPLFPLATQHRIATILSTYDELIETNARRIRILDEMAQSIYREWFVELRFPGHDEPPLFESPLGPIPQGWSVVPLSDVAAVVMGQSPKSAFYNEDGEGLPFHQGVTNFGEYFPATKMYSTAGDRRAREGDVLFSVRAPVGRINVATGDLILGRGLCGIRSNSDERMFVLFQLKDRFRELDTMGSGAIFNAVKKSDVNGIKMILPPKRLLSAFEHAVSPMFALLQTLASANAKLQATRDLLLPGLVSGDIDVSDLDIDVGDAAA